MSATNDRRSATELPVFVERTSATLTRSLERLYNLRRKIATFAVFALAALVAYHVVFGANGTIVYGKKRAELKTVNAEVQTLQKENDQLADQIKALKSDPKAIEKEARTQLHYARPGEVIYLLPGQKRPDSPPANATAQK